MCAIQLKARTEQDFGDHETGRIDDAISELVERLEEAFRHDPEFAVEFGQVIRRKLERQAACMHYGPYLSEEENREEMRYRRYL